MDIKIVPTPNYCEHHNISYEEGKRCERCHEARVDRVVSQVMVCIFLAACGWWLVAGVDYLVGRLLGWSKGLYVAVPLAVVAAYLLGSWNERRMRDQHWLNFLYKREEWRKFVDDKYKLGAPR